MITATEAREAMPSNIINKWIAETTKLICTAAENNYDHVRLRSVLKESIVYKVVYDKKPPKEYLKFKAVMEDKGFVIKEHYEARQFVDMDIIISW